MSKSSKGPWYGFDLDCTLAESPPKNGKSIGEPIPNIVRQAQKYIREGKDVRIFTARVSVVPGEENGPYGNVKKAQNILDIEQWCRLYIGFKLPITCSKDRLMKEIWDDRAIQVVPNTGEILEDTVEMLKRQLKAKHG
jgi:hypothetical protein